ncbi:MAG: hypothetical protein ACKPER_03515 [Dolichospermum sp.]
MFSTIGSVRVSILLIDVVFSRCQQFVLNRQDANQIQFTASANFQLVRIAGLELYLMFYFVLLLQLL